MRSFIVFFATMAFAAASPGILASYSLGAPIGADGRVLDTPEVAQAKAAHFAQHAYESVRNNLGSAAAYSYSPLAYVHFLPYGAAPIGADGRVIDTPEVAIAKAAHLNAHAQEAAKNAGHPYGALTYAALPTYAYGYPHHAPIGADGNVVDTPEVAQAKAAHFAAHAEEHAKHNY